MAGKRLQHRQCFGEQLAVKSPAEQQPPSAAEAKFDSRRTRSHRCLDEYGGLGMRQLAPPAEERGRRDQVPAAELGDSKPAALLPLNDLTPFLPRRRFGYGHGRRV